ncbi:MAG: hypothetical protein ACQESB_00670 [Elusimicrobiota bacterium]
MSQKNFRNIFLDNILDFIWRQWSSVGVLGHTRTEDKWIVDPEALLFFSINMGRFEPRLFDEIIDWLITNGEWIDIQRMRGIVKNKDEDTKRILSAIAAVLMNEAKSYKRKWKSLSKIKKQNKINREMVLFKSKDATPYPIMKNKEDKIFSKYMISRSVFKPSNKSREVNPKTYSNIRFLLRSLFGIGSRAECILYLLSHTSGHPSEIAESIGISVRGTQDALIELSKSNLILTRSTGKRKIEYWLSERKWWQFLLDINIDEINPPIWLNWVAIFDALYGVWEVLNEVQKTQSDYLRSSKLRKAMETIGMEFYKSEIDLPPIPDKTIRPEEYEEEFQNFILKVLGA